ncbi:MAG: CHAT domain-containing protein [bacterium]|jgi:hypothetical protein
MKPIEIEIIPVSGESVSVSVNFSAPGSTPIIRRWHVERSTLDEINGTIEEIVEKALAGRSRGGGGSQGGPEGGPAESLENAGRTFFEVLFRQQCDRLRAALRGGDLYFIFKVDRSLAHLPFEVLHDGERFLSRDFALGRVIYSETGHQNSGGAAGGDRVLILGDPSDDAAIRDDVEREVDSLRDLFKKEGGYGMTIGMGREVSERMVLSLLPETALLHFTGHGAAAADGTAGLELYRDRVLSAEAFKGVKHPPAVAFFNTCSTASHEAWRSPLGIMEALISRGTRACIAPVWDVASGAATSVALAFYKHLLKDETFGEALRKARADVARNGDPGDPTWAAYALYGDPLSGLRTPTGDARGRRRAGIALRVVFAVIAALLLLLTPRTMDRRMTDVVVPVEVGYVIFESEPADARIFLDGKDVGLTPAAIEVSVGEHQVALMKKGYRRWQASVDVKKGPETVVRAVLQRTEE